MTRNVGTRWMGRLRRAGVAASAALLACSAAWGLGFAWFEYRARQPATALPDVADGIVVLTGGADRIETALTLLADGRAPLLLVSGVARGADLAEMARRVRLDPARIAGQVTLGRTATTTVGNGTETAQWAATHGLRRLIVVTAGYHMPRALLELSRGLPDAELYPAPVVPPALRGGTDPATVRMLANEYDKLIAVRLHLTSLIRTEAAR
jgi:uncharacterized SAM-binding protein YcdF (DUF218 family)